MNIWVISTVILLLALIPAIIASIRGDLLDRLIGVQLAGILSTLAFITTGMAAERSVFMDAAIIIALLSFCGGLVYVQFAERWL